MVFSSLHHTCGKRSGWKHSAVAPRMHVTGKSFVSRTRSNRNGKEECPLWINPPSFATSCGNVRNVNLLSSCVWGHGVSLLSILQVSARVESTCCAFMPQLLSRLCTVLLCSTSHTRDGWEFRDPCFVLDQTEAEECKKDCSLPICPPSLRKIRDCSIFLFLSFFLFFFLATKSQVGCRQREKLVANGD